MRQFHIVRKCWLWISCVDGICLYNRKYKYSNLYYRTLADALPGRIITTLWSPRVQHCTDGRTYSATRSMAHRWVAVNVSAFLPQLIKFKQTIWNKKHSLIISKKKKKKYTFDWSPPMEHCVTIFIVKMHSQFSITGSDAPFPVNMPSLVKTCHPPVPRCTGTFWCFCCSCCKVSLKWQTSMFGDTKRSVVSLCRCMGRSQLQIVFHVSFRCSLMINPL